MDAAVSSQKLIYFLFICAVSLLFLTGAYLYSNADGKADDYSSISSYFENSANTRPSTGLFTTVPIFVHQRNTSRPAFDAAFLAYLERHQKAIKCIESDGCELPNIVVNRVAVNAGHGNRFPSMACSLLVAMLTDRILMFNYPGHESLISLKLPTNWPTYNSRYAGDGDGLHFNLGDMLGNNLTTIYSQHRVVTYIDDDFGCPRFQVNPHYQETLREWFPTGDMFHFLINRVVTMSPLISDRLLNLTSQFENNTIGIHVRRHKPIKNGLPKVETYCQVASKLAMTFPPDQSVGFFIASDDKPARDELIQCLQNRNFHSISYLKDTDFSRKPSSNNPTTDVDAILDFFQLAHCDRVVVTYMSSFGSVAASYGYKQQDFVMPERALDDNSRVAFWGSSVSEPCMHRGKRIYAENHEQFKLHPNVLYHSQCHDFI